MMRYWIIVVVLSVLGGGQVLGAEKDVVINEVLADPPSGDRGDANGDGMWPERSNYEDEFVEILNTGLDTIPIGGWQLTDNSKTSKPFSFPSDTVIGPGEYIVLFGGGDITKIKSEFEGKVFVDDGKIGSRGFEQYKRRGISHKNCRRYHCQSRMGERRRKGPISGAISGRDWQVGIAQC